MRVLAFRHGPSDDLGLIRNILDARGITCECADLYKASPDSAVPDADALIVLGGAMSANDEFVFLHREIEIVRDAVRTGKPALGICLGAQLIARALGAKVYPNFHKEIGWVPVDFTDAARSDPLFRGLTSEVIFHWHGETFDLPQGASLLASSAACRHQAYRVGDRIYGFQFHLEVTPEIISQWCVEDEAACGAREATEPIDPYAHSAGAEHLAQTVFGRWCDLIRQQSSSSG